MINLLPIEEKKLLTREQKEKLVIILSLELICFLIFVFLLILALIFYLLGEIKSQKFLLKEYEEELVSPYFLKIKDVVQRNNDNLLRISSFYQDKKLMSDALDVLFQVPRPEGLYFSNLLLQSIPETNLIKVEIIGISETREKLLSFKEGLENERRIKNLSFSPESWLSPENINFKINLEIINER